jgi:hypothetical protein
MFWTPPSKNFFLDMALIGSIRNIGIGFFSKQVSEPIRQKKNKKEPPA